MIYFPQPHNKEKRDLHLVKPATLEVIPGESDKSRCHDEIGDICRYSAGLIAKVERSNGSYLILEDRSRE